MEESIEKRKSTLQQANNDRLAKIKQCERDVDDVLSRRMALSSVDKDNEDQLARIKVKNAFFYSMDGHVTQTKYCLGVGCCANGTRVH